MNDKLLIEEIEKSLISKNQIAVKLGITRQAFYKKLSGEREFKASEIKKLTEILCLSVEKVNDIFFADFVDKNAYKN